MSPPASTSVRLWASWKGSRSSRRHASGDVVAGLEEVAHDERDPEPMTLRPAAAEGQADRQARLVHAVEQAPEQVAGPDDTASVPGRPPDEPFDMAGQVVVVAHEDRSIPKPDALRAGADERRRIDQRQHASGQVAATAEVDQRPLGREQLRHVPAQRRGRCPRSPAARLRLPTGTSAGSPPSAARRRLPELTRRRLRNGPERDRDAAHGRQRSGVRPLPAEPRAPRENLGRWLEPGTISRREPVDTRRAINGEDRSKSSGGV